MSVETDGSVAISHTGVDTGQGIHVKIAQVAARELKSLGCGFADLSVSTTSTRTAASANTTCTGGSQTTEDNAKPVLAAVRALKARLAPFAAAGKSWVEIVNAAAAAAVDLQARSHYVGPASALGEYAYVAYGVAATVVEVDGLSGEVRVLEADLLVDCGTSLNPAIDSGQVIGGYALALSYLLHEEICWDAETGRLSTAGTWEYKPLSAWDVPEVFNCTLVPNAPCPTGFMGSKASAEPPLLLAAGALSAARQALAALRAEQLPGPATSFTLDAPVTPVQVAGLLAGAST